MRCSLLSRLAYIVSALGDHVKESVLGAKERQRTAEEDEEHDAAAPDVHRLAVRFPAHHLWCHEMRGANAPYKDTKNVSIKNIKRHQLHVHVISAYTGWPTQKKEQSFRH